MRKNVNFLDMPNAKKRVRASRNNLDLANEVKVAGQHEGSYGVDPTSPIVATNDLKRTPMKKVPFGMAQTLRKRPATPFVPRKSAKQVFLEATESKYNAVIEYQREWSVNRRLSNERTEELASHYGITGGYLRSLAKKVGTRSLTRKPGSGLEPSISTRKDIIEFMEAKAKEWDYEFAQRAMAGAVKAKFGVGCLSTIQKIMMNQEWKKSKKYIKPYLSEEHETARLEWAEEREDTDFFSSDKVVVHVDEKYFYAFRTGKVVYYPPGCEPSATTALSKTQIPKVMFFGAVAPPNPGKKFDGRIGLWMVSETKTAQRASKYHAVGDVFEIPTMMNGELFVSMCKKLLIPAICKKLSWAKKVEVQMDSAGGHKINTSVDELNNLCAANYKISFCTQPTRSPDLNVLDLGIWNSLQSGVPTIKYDPDSEHQMFTRIEAEVMRAWNEYDGTTKLTKIFHTLNLIYKEVIKAKGGNNFKLPHSRNY